MSAPMSKFARTQLREMRIAGSHGDEARVHQVIEHMRMEGVPEQEVRDVVSRVEWWAERPLAPGEWLSPDSPRLGLEPGYEDAGYEDGEYEDGGPDASAEPDRAASPYSWHWPSHWQAPGPPDEPDGPEPEAA
jgi:hypothetical protein